MIKWNLKHGLETSLDFRISISMVSYGKTKRRNSKILL